MVALGLLLTVALLVGIAAGVWSVYRLLDTDSKWDVSQWWLDRYYSTVPFSRALVYRVRRWWRRKRHPELATKQTEMSAQLPNFISQLFEMSPLDSPFLRMIGMENKTLTAGDYEEDDGGGYR